MVHVSNTLSSLAKFLTRAMLLLLFLLGSASAAKVNDPKPTKLVFIIRHGEKIYNGDSPAATEFECLSEKGWSRAYNLKSVFGPSGVYPTPDAIFSADYADQATQQPNCIDRNGWYRTQQTVAALAQAAPGGLGLQVDNSTSFMPLYCGQLVAPASKCQLSPLYPPAWVSPNGTCCPYGLVTPAGDAAALGMCCNAAAAEKILAKLAEPAVETILVAWESINIGYLAEALGVPADEAACPSAYKLSHTCAHQIT